MNEGAAEDGQGARRQAGRSSTPTTTRRRRTTRSRPTSPQKVDGHHGRRDRRQRHHAGRPGGRRRRHPGRRGRRHPARRPAEGPDRRRQRRPARTIGKYFLEYVKANGGKAKLGVVGALNSFIQNVRQKGFEDVVKAAPASRWPASSTAGTSRTTRMAAAENLMTANPDLTAIYATGEPALLGAVAAVESQGRQDRRQGLRLGPHRARRSTGIDAGYVVARGPAGPGRHGCGGGRGGLTAIVNGRHRRAKCIAVPITIVTKENVEPLPRRSSNNGGGRVRERPRPPGPRASGCAGSARRFGSIEALRGVDLDLWPGRGARAWSATTPPASRR